MPTLPRLLFVSPIFPASTGNGLAMRAFAMMNALSEDFQIHLVAPGSPSCKRPDTSSTWYPLPRPRLRQALKRLQGSDASPFEWSSPSRRAMRRIVSDIGTISFEHIHVFRLYMLPVAESLLRQLPPGHGPIHLDFDDIESDTRAGMASCLPEGRERRRTERAAQFYSEKENALLPRCDRIYVCGEKDRELLHQRGFHALSIVPNSVEIRESFPLPEQKDPFTFLFVGNLNHFPNVDGILYLLGDVVPAMRVAGLRPFRILIVGSGPRPAQLQDLSRLPEVEWRGHVDDVSHVYHEAHATLIPLRCGGGTRIKILESFAMQRPVISTPAGARGLEVEDGVELRIASDPAEFARACAEVMTSQDLCRNLIAAGRTWVEENASPEQLRESLQEALNRGHPT